MTSDWLAQAAPLSCGAKQSLLGMSNTSYRLKILVHLLEQMKTLSCRGCTEEVSQYTIADKLESKCLDQQAVPDMMSSFMLTAPAIGLELEAKACIGRNFEGQTEKVWWPGMSSEFVSACLLAFSKFSAWLFFISYWIVCVVLEHFFQYADVQNRWLIQHDWSWKWKHLCECLW